ncbi:hypothetical protein [Leptolyngbya sp. KIOST-1]|uniref:hypothetical protein n=1 Tax=Leptolyngbya sp. KIOST-1 TaxID=1229172 RepID=UPI000AAA86B9|nr:hypothetical protein [Leptolyngbya sp. KIOST-1]
MTALSPWTIYSTSDGEPVAATYAHLYALLTTPECYRLGDRSGGSAPLNQT